MAPQLNNNKHPNLEDTNSDRLDRYFESHPVRTLSNVEAEAIRWDRTAELDEAHLKHHYVTLGKSMGFQLGRLLHQHPLACEQLRDADRIVVIGPGFGDEIDIVMNVFTTGEEIPRLTAVELNRHAWGGLAFERPFLDVHQHLDEVDPCQGQTIFVCVHVLRQPSLANDWAMEEFGSQLLRIAPSGFTLFSTLPHSYEIASEYAERSNSLFGGRINSDEVLTRIIQKTHHAELHVKASLAEMGSFGSRLSVLTVGEKK